MTLTPDRSPAALWLGLDPADGGVDERHVEHTVLGLLDGLGLAADLVCTHVVEVPGGVRVAASARLAGLAGGALAEAGLLARLGADWDGAAVLQDAGDGGAAVEMGPLAARDGARAAVRQALDGRAARAARFPGQEALDGPLPVADVPLVCAVEAVVPVVGEVGPGTVLDPCGHVRPRLEGGRLVLDVRPGPGGTVVPVERRSVHACAGH